MSEEEGASAHGRQLDRNGRLDVDVMARLCGDQGGRQPLIYLRGSVVIYYICPFLTHVILSRVILSKQRDQR